MLEYDFMRTAFAASGMAAVLAGTVGFFLVLRGQTFAGHALSHVGFTGATGAVLFGLSPLAGLVGFTFVSGIGMGLFGEKLAERDVAIGMMLSLALGLGLLFLHFYTTGATQAAALLFGNVLGVDESALLTLALLSVGSLVALAAIARPLIFASLQPDLAEARGVPIRFVSVAFLAIVGIAVAECAQIVGVLLVFTLMVGPAAAAQNFSRRLIGGVVAGGMPRTCRGVGRIDAGLYHRLADLVLDHGALRHHLSHEPRRPISSPLRPPEVCFSAQAGGKDGLEPPFHCPSSTRLREIEREIPPEFGRPGLARLCRLAAVLGAIAMARSTCGGPVDQGFVDAGMDDHNPALWNIRHDITPMLIEWRVDYPLHRFRAVIRVTYRGLGSFAVCASAGGAPPRSSEPRPSQRLQSGYATAAITKTLWPATFCVFNP